MPGKKALVGCCNSGKVTRNVQPGGDKDDGDEDHDDYNGVGRDDGYQERVGAKANFKLH